MWWARLLNSIIPIFSTAGAATFQPTDIANCKLWLDASDTTKITLNGSGVSQWTDKTTNGYTFTQSTSSNQPTSGVSTINSKNVITFDGTNDYLTSTAASSTWSFMHNSTGYTAFFAGRYQTPSIVNVYWQTNFANLGNIGAALNDELSGGNGLLVHDVARGVSGAANAVSRGYAGTTVANNGNFYVSAIINNTTATAADRVKIRIKGGAESKTNTATNAASSSNPSNNLTFGTDNNTVYSKIWIAEVIFYTGQLSDTDVSTVNSYLASKWAI